MRENFHTGEKGKGETAKEKRKKKKEFLENKEKVFKVVLPSIGAFTIIICFVVYVFTRQKQ